MNQTNQPNQPEATAPDTATYDGEVQIDAIEATATDVQDVQAPVAEVAHVVETPVEVIEPAPVVEVPPEPVVAPTPVVEEVQPTPVITPAEPSVKSTQGASEEVDYLDKIRLEGTPTQKRILAAVETFYGQMTPRAPLKPADVANFQHEFLQHLLWLLEKDYTEFRSAWNVLLVFFSVYHRDDNRPDNYSPLSEYSTTRYKFAWTKGEEKAVAYTNLITLLRATRNRMTRKHDIKTIDLAKVAPGVLSTDALNNLQQYYA